MNIRPGSPGTPPNNPPSDGSQRFEPDRQVICPMGREIRLRVVNHESMLVECGLNGIDVCPKAFLFGGGYYCGLLFQSGRRSS